MVADKRTDKKRYEPDFVAVKPFALLISGLMALTTLVILVLYPLFAFKAQAPGAGRGHSLDRLSEPQLADDSGDEWRAIRAAARERLNSYGWINRKQGVVRIPIERAMDLVLRDGLPARNTPEQEAP